MFEGGSPDQRHHRFEQIARRALVGSIGPLPDRRYPFGSTRGAAYGL